MKKFVSIMLALAMSMSLAACGADSSSDASSDSQSSSDAASGEKVVKIGVFEPATGDSGAGGKQKMLGMQYANHMTPLRGHRRRDWSVIHAQLAVFFADRMPD